MAQTSRCIDGTKVDRDNRRQSKYVQSRFSLGYRFLVCENAFGTQEGAFHCIVNKSGV